MAETTCPVFRPTEQEFKSFRRYIEDVVDRIAGKAGLCKIIPPPGWAARRRDTAEEMCKSVYIPAPIRQCVSSTRSNGVYSVDVVENPPMTLAEFKEYADKRAPFPSSTASAGCPGSAAVGVRRGRSGGVSSADAADGGGADGEGGGGRGRGGGGCGYGGGYGFSSGGGSAGSGTQAGSSRAEESEVARRVRMFWRSLGPNSEAPVYGADTLGTLFAEDDNDAWNVGRLDTILQLLKANLPGITTPMLYAGMWRSMFAFHVEDVNLYSINYLHRGDPKSWYGIPPGSRQRFESLAQAFFTEEFRTCKHHMRHKTTMISPLQIQKAGIGYCTAVQEAGEFMITFPGSYHGGFNHGFNLAESTNFAIDRWISQGRGAGYCRCSPHSVRIDVDRFETLVRQHRRTAGKESTCLNGLAETPATVALASAGRAAEQDSSSTPADARSRTQPAAPASEAFATTVEAAGASPAGGSGSQGHDDDEDDSDEDSESEWREEVDMNVQVFHCVCSHVRSMRRVQWAEDGSFVVAPPETPPSSSSSSSSAATAVPAWPDEEDIAPCPRCGVWGHKTCLEYVVPLQYAIPEPGTVFYATRAECGSSNGPGATAACNEQERDGTPARIELPETLAGVDKLDPIRSAGNAADNGAGIAADLTATATAAAAAAAVTAAENTTSPPTTVVYRPVCWMCMQEKEDVAAMSVAAGPSGGGAAAAAPRRTGKTSGGGNSGAAGGGGGGGGSGNSSSSGGVSSAQNSAGGGTRENHSGAKNNAGPKKKTVVKGEELKARKRVRTCESGGGGGGACSSTKKASAGARATPTEAVRASAVDSAVPGALKRARIGPRLIGKEVLVSDGVAVVLTGVVTAIEAGQARLHYKGRKAKLDEWIDVRSERFLSATEAKKQIELTQLAMSPSAGHVTGPYGGPAGKKRKAVLGGGGSEKTGGGSGGKRAKKGGDGDGVEKARSKKDSDKKLGDGKTGTAGGENKAGPTKAKTKTAGDGTNANATGNRKKDGKTVAFIRKKHRSGEKIANGAKEAAVKSSSPSRKSKTKTGKMRAIGGCETGSKRNAGGKKAGESDIRSNGSSQLKSAGGKSSQAEALGNGSSTGRSSAGGTTSSKTKHHSDKKVTKKKPRMGLSITPTVIPPPVVVQREVPEHHVISNRRAVVLARTFAKETEEAQKDFEEAVAAAERSRVAREQRLKASSPRVLPRPPASQGAASSYAAKSVGGGSASANDPTAAATAVSSGPGRRCVWPDLGFGGQPWGLGPFYREEEAEGGDSSASLNTTMDRKPSLSPSCASFAEGGSSHSRKPGEQGKLEHIDAHAQGCVAELGETRQGDGSAAKSPVGAASASAAIPTKPPRALKEVRRARVDAGEAVDLGEDAAFRKWLGRLRAIQDIPAGHVEKCSRSLAVLLGTSPPDGSVRASVRALLVAETLRGGASHEVATFVRSLAGLMADAASKARPSKSAASTSTVGNPVIPSGGDSHDNAQFSPGKDEVCVDTLDLDAKKGHCAVGDNTDPAAVSIRDKEGAAAYAHALAYLARSKRKQDRAAALAIREKEEAEAVAAAAAAALAEAQSSKKGKKTKKAAWAMRRHLEAVETAQVVVLPSSKEPPPAVVGNLLGGYPFSRSGDSLLIHAKAMVGLKRAHRWVTAWLNAPSNPRTEGAPRDVSRDNIISANINASRSSKERAGAVENGPDIIKPPTNNADSSSKERGGAVEKGTDVIKPPSACGTAARVGPVAHPPPLVVASAPPAPATHHSLLATTAASRASAAHASPLVAAAAASAAAAAATRRPCYSAGALIGWQHAFMPGLPPALPPHASLRAAVLSSAPATAAPHYPAAEARGAAATAAAAAVTAAAAAAVGALPTMHPRPYMHGTCGGLSADSAAAYHNALLSMWPPAAVGGVGWSTPSNAPATMPAAPTPAPAPAPAPASAPAGSLGGPPVDLLARWEKVGAVAVAQPVPGAGGDGDDEEVMVD